MSKAFPKRSICLKCNEQRRWIHVPDAVVLGRYEDLKDNELRELLRDLHAEAKRREYDYEWWATRTKDR